MSANPISQEATSLLGTAERRAAAVAVCVALALGALGFSSWLEARDDRVRLSATVASQGSLIAAAEKREQDRAQELADTLKQIAALKSSVQTPLQVIREMPQFLPPLPQPLESIASKPAAAGGPASSGAGPGADKQNAAKSGGTDSSAQPGTAAAPDVRVPAADLKPLFDFVQDCRACQAKLTAAQQDAEDEHAKNDALTKERDAAEKAAKGGGVWTRTVRAAKWLAIGFAVGYVAHAGIR